MLEDHTLRERLEVAEKLTFRGRECDLICRKRYMLRWGGTRLFVKGAGAQAADEEGNSDAPTRVGPSLRGELLLPKVRMFLNSSG